MAMYFVANEDQAGSIPAIRSKFMRDIVWKLFLDDVRHPSDDTWIIARSSKQAIDLVLKLGVPNTISFDHDLGWDDSSMIFIDWLLEKLIEKNLTLPIDFTYTVHSMNPVGKENIECLMNNIVKHFMRV